MGSAGLQGRPSIARRASSAQALQQRHRSSGCLFLGAADEEQEYIARRHWRLLAQSERVLAIGLGAALLAFFLHGAVDYFMEFTPTYGLFWLIAGLLVGLLTGTLDVEFAGTADRV